MGSQNVIEIVIRATDQASKALDNIANKFGGRMQSIGKNLMRTGAMMGLAAAPIAGALGVAISSASQFEESMANVRAVLGATPREMDAISDKLIEMGAQSREGPQSVAAAFYDIVGGVADASTHMAILDAAIATSEAGAASLGGTTSALISIMNSYGFAADQASFASDVLTQTVGMGVGTMDEFAAALPQVAGLASSLGVDFDSLGASMAFLTTKGFTASESATQLRAMMTALINPNEQMKRAFQEAGIASGELAIEQLGLVGAFQALAAESPTFQQNMAGTVGSVQALNGVIALTDETYGQFEKDFIEGTEGLTDAARKIQLDSLAAQTDLLKSSFDALKITIGMMFIPALTSLVSAAVPVVNAITKWVSKNQALFKAIGVGVGVLAALAAASSAVGAAMFAVGAIISFLVSPIGLIVAGVMALYYGFTKLTEIFPNLIPGLKNAFKLLKDGGSLEGILYSLDAAFGLSFGTMASWVDKFKNFAGEIKAAYDAGGLVGVGTLIVDKISAEIEAAGGLSGIAQKILDKIAPAVDAVTTWVNDTIVTPIVNAFNAIDWGEVEAQLDAILEVMLSGAKSIADWLKEKIWDPLQTGLEDSAKVQGIAESAGKIAASILDGLAGVIGDIATWVNDTIIQPIVDAITGKSGEGSDTEASGAEVGKSVLSGLATAFLNLGDWIVTNIINPFVMGLTGENITTIFNTGKEMGIAFLEGIPGALLDLASWLLNNVIMPIATALVNEGNLDIILTSGKGIARKVLDGILDVFSAIADWILTNVITPIVNAIGDAAQDVLDAGINLGKKILQGIIDGIKSAPGAIAAAILGEIPGSTISERLGMEYNPQGYYTGATATRLHDYVGPAMRGRAYAIGRRAQPELFVPNTSGMMYPAGQWPAMGGGTQFSLAGATIMVNNPANYREFLRELEREAKRQNRSLTGAPA